MCDNPTHCASGSLLSPIAASSSLMLPILKQTLEFFHLGLVGFAWDTVTLSVCTRFICESIALGIGTEVFLVLAF